MPLYVLSRLVNYWDKHHQCCCHHHNHHHHQAEYKTSISVGLLGESFPRVKVAPLWNWPQSFTAAVQHAWNFTSTAPYIFVQAMDTLQFNSFLILATGGIVLWHRKGSPLPTEWKVAYVTEMVWTFWRQITFLVPS